VNIITIICVAIGLLCLFYDAKFLSAEDPRNKVVVDQLVNDIQKGKIQS